jgi:hypothetical protein
MKYNRYAVWAPVALVLGAFAFTVLAQEYDTKTQRVNSVSTDGSKICDNLTDYRTTEAPITTERSVDLDELVGTSYVGSMVSCSGYSSVTFWGWFSTPADTCKVWVVRIHYKDGTQTVKGISNGTLTATSIFLDVTNQLWPSENVLEFPTYGATHVQFLVDPSSGTFTPGPVGVY